MLQVKKVVEYTLSPNELEVLVKSYRDGKCYLDDNKINLENASRIDASKILYGIEIYDVLIKAVSDLKHGVFDIRSFRVLYNHMSLYLYILDIFNINNLKLYVESITQLINNSKMLSILYLKMKMDGNFELEKNLIERICSLRREEVSFLDKLIELLM